MADYAALKAGYIMIKYTGRLKMWQRRYVLLDSKSLTLYKVQDDVDAAKTLKQFDLRNDIAGVIAPNGKTVGGAGKLSDFDFALQLKDNAMLLLRTGSTDEQHQWLTVMQQALGHEPRQKAFRQTSVDTGAVEMLNMEPKQVSQLYDFKDLLGSGIAGQVHRALNKKTGQMVAIKTISKEKFLVNNRSKITTRREIDILRMIADMEDRDGSDHLVALYAVIETRENLHLVMELVEGGELFSRVCDKGVYTEPEARRVMNGLCEALQLLHKNGIVHRDIKPENILLKSDEEDCHIKLTDFGLSNTMDGDFLKSKCGTPVYMAPEMLQRKPYDTKVDVWSCGIILYIVVSGTLPFYADNPDEFLELVLDSQFEFPDDDTFKWSSLSDEIQDLIKQILIPNARERLSLEGIMEHPWMKMDESDV